LSIELALIPVAIAITQTIGSHMEKKMQFKDSYKIKTIMKDEILLQKALNHYGCKAFTVDSHQMESSIGDLTILFQRNNEGIFDAVFDSTIEFEHADQFVKNIETEYIHLVQQETYLKLMERAKEQGLVLESEELKENNAIVLTFKVNS
jgi:hypothetical protein